MRNDEKDKGVSTTTVKGKKEKRIDGRVYVCAQS